MGKDVAGTYILHKNPSILLFGKTGPTHSSGLAESRGFDGRAGRPGAKGEDDQVNFEDRSFPLRHFDFCSSLAPRAS